MGARWTTPNDIEVLSIEGRPKIPGAYVGAVCRVELGHVVDADVGEVLDAVQCLKRASYALCARAEIEDAQHLCKGR